MNAGETTEEALLDTLKIALRGAFHRAVSDTPFVVALQIEQDIPDLREKHEEARDAADDLSVLLGYRRIRSFDCQGLLHPVNPEDTLRWVAYSHGDLAQEYARVMKAAGIPAAVYSVTVPDGEPADCAVLSPFKPPTVN
jgi:hypothetical protein